MAVSKTSHTTRDQDDLTISTCGKEVISDSTRHISIEEHERALCPGVDDRGLTTKRKTFNLD